MKELEKIAKDQGICKLYFGGMKHSYDDRERCDPGYAG